MNKDFLTKLGEKRGSEHPGGLSALSLAYLGDAVFELCTRAKVIEEHDATVNRFHKISKTYVSAIAQAQMYKRLLEVVNEEEEAILRRGRNAKSFTTAKNASVAEYRHATGVEALFGYLFLSGKTERIMELFEVCVREKE